MERAPQGTSRHIRAIGRAKEGWHLFNDQAEAQFLRDPPFLSHWVSVWLVRDVWTKLTTPMYWQFGLDLTTDQMTTHLDAEGLDWDGFKAEWIQRLRAHCSLCGRMTLTHEAWFNMFVPATMISCRNCKLMPGANKPSASAPCHA